MNCYFIYLISINVFSLALYFFDYFIYSKNRLIDALTTYVVIAGGGIGAMLAYMICVRQVKNDAKGHPKR